MDQDTRTCWRCKDSFDANRAAVGGDLCNACWLEIAAEQRQEEIDVYRYALALACGEEDYPRNLAPSYVCDYSAADTVAIAQDELRHGRGPEWLTEDHD